MWKKIVDFKYRTNSPNLFFQRWELLLFGKECSGPNKQHRWVTPGR
jgi:hypothetical protein